MAIFGTNTNYILSKKIKVFPTNFRGTYSTNTRNLINDVNIETYGFDPESKLTTEKNLISLPGNSFGNDSYIIDYTIPDSTGAGKYTLKFVLGGYYFEIFDDKDFLADLSEKCFSIKTKSVQLTTGIDTTSATQNLLTTNNTYDSSRETTQLTSWIDDDDDLDHYDGESDNYFTGIYVSNEVGEGATASLKNIVLQKNSEYILNKNLCRIDIRSGLGNNSVRLSPKTGSKATGNNSLAAGYNTEASGKNSAAFGSNTVANQNNQFVIGKANVSPTTSTLFIIGDGEINEADSDVDEVTNRKNIVEINSTETKISPKLSVVDTASKNTATYFTTAVDNTSISSNTVSINGLTSTTVSGGNSTLTLSNGNANLKSKQTIIGNTLSNIITDSNISLNSSESIKFSSKNISLNTNTAPNKYFSLTNSIATLSINNIKLDGDITATGTTTINGSTTINGTANITNTLTVVGATTLNNTLNVGKKLTANNDVQITNGNLVLGSNTQSSATIYLTSTGSETGFLNIDSYNLTLSKGSTLTISSNEITLSLSGTTASSHLTLTKNKLYSNVPIDAYLEKTLPDLSNSYTDYIIADDGKNKFKLSIGNQDYTNIIRTQTGANKLYSTKEIADLFTLNPRQVAKVYPQATKNRMITTKSTVNKGNVIGISSLSLDKILYSDNITDLKKLAAISKTSCFQNVFTSENNKETDKFNTFVFKSKNKNETKQFIAINTNGNTVTDDLVINNTLKVGPEGNEVTIYYNKDKNTTTFSAPSLNLSGSLDVAKSITVAETITANSFNAKSDARLKENLVPYTPKKSILDLPIYKYNFIGKNETHIGCLAQDLEKICPELVSKDNDGYLSIKETKLVYLLLEEVKKLKAELEEIKNK